MSISKTCRRFYHIMNTLISSNHPKLQTPLVFISPKLGIPHKPFPTLLAPGPGIKLKVKRPKKKSLSIFLEMVRRRALPFGKCANLCVDQIVQNSPDPLLPYLENWPTGLLLSLKLESEITPIDFMSFLSHPAFHQSQAILRSLKISGSGHFSEEHQEKSPIDTICSSSACRELKELYIEDAGVHTKDIHLGRKIAESPYMVNLEALFFSSCAVTVEDFEALSSTNSHVKKLKKLSIYNKGNILSEEDTTRIFELIADSENFAHLTEMTVIGTGNITNAAIYALCVSKHIKNLHYFYMMNQSRLSKEIIIPIATSVNFENAKELNFFLEKRSPDFSVEERKIMSEHPVFQKINFSMSW